MINNFVAVMASHEPAEIVSSLERLVDAGKVSMDEALRIYTDARRLQLVNEARSTVKSAARAMVVHALNTVGHVRNKTSESEEANVYQRLENALDILVKTVSQSRSKQWTLVPIAGSVPSSPHETKQA